MNTYNHIVDISDQVFALPAGAQQTLNHCNLPAMVLGSLEFQHHPVYLLLDGVQQLHAPLFSHLDSLKTTTQRARYFMDYMVVQFRLHRLEEAGLDKNKEGKRSKADYRRLLRGWLFDANGREAAVLKGWVESRFGLLPRFHGGSFQSPVAERMENNQDRNYQSYIQLRAQGLLGTNALEAQLDLLYSYGQYELARRYKNKERLQLYRGINHLHEYDVLKQVDKHHAVVVLNNINSFTSNRERADEFGDQLLEVMVPWQKVLYFSSLLPGMLEGEDEYIVIGGVYLVHISLW
jgi:NAD+--dinitrogen-reductase ADP-D-ribosyltransferase